MKITDTKHRLIELLRETGDSQNEMARKTGLTKSAISNYINGTREPRQDAIFKISEAYKVSPSWLMGLDVPEKISEYNDEFHNKLNLDMLMKEFDVNANAMTPIEYFLNEQNKKKKEPEVDIEQVRKIMAMAMDPNSPMNKAIKMYDLFKNAPAHIQAAIENLLKENPHET